MMVAVLLMADTQGGEREGMDRVYEQVWHPASSAWRCGVHLYQGRIGFICGATFRRG
jgi:hypothetical protein